MIICELIVWEKQRWKKRLLLEKDNTQDSEHSNQLALVDNEWWPRVVTEVIDLIQLMSHLVAVVFNIEVIFKNHFVFYGGL